MCENVCWSQVLAAPVITVIGGAIVVNSFFVRRANEASFIDHIVEELTALREASLEYWGQDYDPKKSRQSEVRIRGIFLCIMHDSRFYYEQHHLGFFRSCWRFFSHQTTWKFWKWTKPKVRSALTPDCLAKLVDACTGGDFESTIRQADPTRNMKIALAIAEAKRCLVQYKL